LKVLGEKVIITVQCIRAPPIPPESWWSTDILSSSNLLQGVDQQILPCGQGRIDSVKVNPSLLTMRKWHFQPDGNHCSSMISSRIEKISPLRSV